MKYFWKRIFLAYCLGVYEYYALGKSDQVHSAYIPVHSSLMVQKWNNHELFVDNGYVLELEKKGVALRQLTNRRRLRSRLLCIILHLLLRCLLSLLILRPSCRIF